MTQLINSIEIMSCQYYCGIHKTKKSVNYLFFPSLSLFFCYPLLPKCDGAADVPSGEVRAAPAPEEGLRAATLFFHSFCQAPCRVKSPRDMPGSQQKHIVLEAEELVWERDACVSGILIVTNLLCDSTDVNS